MAPRRSRKRRKAAKRRVAAKVAAQRDGAVAACLRPLFARPEPLKGRLATVFRTQPAWMLPLMLVSGANAFLYEVLWTRMLAHVMGGSI